MKILVVSSFLPYPLFSGGHIRLYNLLKQLSRHHEITLVCEKRKHQTARDVEEVKKICKEVVTIDRKKQWSPEVVFQTAISPLPFLLSGHQLPEMKEKIQMLLEKNQYDLIHVETFYVFQNVPSTSLPIVLVEHNIEYQVYARFMETAPFLVKPLLRIDIEKIKYWEKDSWKKATKVVAVSKKDAEEIGNGTAVVANGVDLKNFHFLPAGRQAISNFQTKEKTILFMGDFKWIQNRSTAEWILKDIWPRVQSSKDLRLWIVGKHIPQTIKQYSNETIIVDEHAPDKTSDIYKNADILLSPIRVGGGTSYKILEAMASGVPVVTTPLGIEGLGATKNKHALVGETSEQLARDVVRLLTDKKVFSAIARDARKFIENNYSWEKIAKDLEDVYSDVVKK